MYMNDANLDKTQICEKMLDEILLEQNIKCVGTLKDFDQFGEQAILRDNIRKASVRCMEDTHLSFITQKDFKRIYENIKKARLDMRVQFLKTVPLF